MWQVHVGLINGCNSVPRSLNDGNRTIPGKTLFRQISLTTRNLNKQIGLHVGLLTEKKFPHFCWELALLGVSRLALLPADRGEPAGSCAPPATLVVSVHTLSSAIILSEYSFL